MKQQTKWKSFVHRGPYFPPKFQATGQLNLSPIAEEMLVAWARQPEERRVDVVFYENFWHDFNFHVSAKDRQIVKDLTEPVLLRRLKLPPMVKDLSPEEKKKRKHQRELLKEQYGHVTINGVDTPCAYGLEPAGIFIGRGNHPKRGMWKSEVWASEVDLNLSAGAPVPPVPKGHGATWGSAEAHPGEYWIARWPCPVGIRGYKYLWTSVESSARQSKEQAKFDKAMKLGRVIGNVRRAYLSHPNWELAAALYLLDHLALRVGDEKGSDKADTVGVTTLRCEHVKFNGSTLVLDFLGKDSVRFKGELTGMPALLVMQLKSRKANSKPSDLLFPHISNSVVNAFLSELMPGLTAKVFRTYHGTRAADAYLQNHLAEDPTSYENPKVAVDYNVEQARYANLAAAKRLNHKRTLPKGWADRVARAREEKKQWLQDSADYNLGTSLTNYIDPRLFVKWNPTGDFKKIYSKALRRKFSWAWGEEDGDVDAS